MESKKYSDQLIVNVFLNQKKNRFETYFMWGNINITLSSQLNELDKNHLNGLKNAGSGGFTKGNGFISFINFEVVIDNFIFPEYLKEHVYEMHRYNNTQGKSQMELGLMNLMGSKKNKIVFTEYNEIKKGDIIKIQVDDESFDEICDDYISTKINSDNLFDNFRLKFIDSILKSKFLDFEIDSFSDNKNENKYKVSFY